MNDALRAQGETGAAEAPDSLASVFDDWQRDILQTAAPSRRLADRLSELLSGVESWRAEVQSSAAELQNRLFGELRILEAKLEGLRSSGAEQQEASRQALRTIWLETKQVSSAVDSWSGSARPLLEDRAELLQSLELIAQRVEDGDARAYKVLQAVDDRMAQRHEDAKSATEHLVASLKERLALLQTTTALVAEGHDELTKSLEAQGSATATALEATTAGLVRSLEAIDDRLTQRHEEAQSAAGRLRESIGERLSALEATITSVRQGLSFVEAAAGSIAQGHDKVLSGLQKVDAGVAQALAAGAEERAELKAQVAALSDSLGQLKLDVRDAANQSEVRLRQHLESVESRTLAAISDLSLALLEEHRATKLEMQNRIDRGVREPLKNAVSLISKQLGDVESTVKRTFDTLRSADLTLKIDSVDALLDPRYRKSQPYDLVELPSPGRGPDGPPTGPAGD